MEVSCSATHCPKPGSSAFHQSLPRTDLSLSGGLHGGQGSRPGASRSRSNWGREQLPGGSRTSARWSRSWRPDSWGGAASILGELRSFGPTGWARLRRFSAPTLTQLDCGSSKACRLSAARIRYLSEARTCRPFLPPNKRSGGALALLERCTASSVGSLVGQQAMWPT